MTGSCGIGTPDIGTLWSNRQPPNMKTQRRDCRWAKIYVNRRLTSMILENMKIGLLPYSDGSGYTYHITLNEGVVEIEQAGNSVDFKRAEWDKIVDAVAHLWATQDKVSG